MTPESVNRELRQMILTLMRRVTGFTELTGDGTAGPGSGSQVFTLANSGVTPGTYGDSNHYPTFTVDAKGRVTFADERPLSGSGGSPAPEVTSWVPLASGAEPLTFISDGAGQPILVSHSA